MGEIWRYYEPGATCIYFSRFECAPLRGRPNFSRVRKIYFGGAPGDAVVRVSLSFLRKRAVTDLMGREVNDGEMLA